MLLKQNVKPTPKIAVMDDYKPIPQPRTIKQIIKPIPALHKSVKQMIREYEDNIILPPLEFRDGYKPIPKPRTIKQIKPIVAPRTKIEQTNKALQGYTKSFKVGTKNSKDPLIQLQNTRKGIENHFKTLLSDTKGFKFVETLKVNYEKISEDTLIVKTAYCNINAVTVTNDNNINLDNSNQDIINKFANWISEGSGWVINIIDNRYINIVKYNPLKGSSYINLPKELGNSAKGLINIKNQDNECFRWCHIRHLNPQEKYPQRIKKTD